MALFGLIETAAERARRTAKDRRRAFRDAERSGEAVKGAVAKLKRKRDVAWKEAADYLRDGQKAASQRALQTCRACEVQMATLERKRWVFDQFLNKFEVAKSDQDLSGALRALTQVVTIDVEAVDEVLGDVDAKLSDQADIDKLWEREYGKEMEGVETHMMDTIPSIEEMSRQLEDEVAADLGSPEPTQREADGPRHDPALAEQIGEAWTRLRKVTEEDEP